MRICLVYDCLFPHTVGGAERWYRNLAERLAADGHAVTYLTLRQWEPGADPGVAGVDVVTVGPRMELYVDGRRRIGPPVRFGAGVLAHLLAHGRRYDVVHTASFPYFSLLAAGVAARCHGFRLVVDWHEVWSREYWAEYLGRAGGYAGWLVQRLCARVPQRAFCFSRLHAARLRAEGLLGEVVVLEGEFVGPAQPASPRPAEPIVVLAGRLIPEKRATALVGAMVAARRPLPELRAAVYGDGPERATLHAAITAHELDDFVALHGFVPAEELERAIAGALCLVVASRREGYGMVVVEASSLGTPSVVVAGPDNAATELIEDGVNGVIAASAEPDVLADAIVRIAAAGPPLRASTAAWYAANARRLSLASSVERVLASYAA
jgi:glycosyltransferase involved in cell wall biosynthesis